jgi:hypothetical protein
MHLSAAPQTSSESHELSQCVSLPRSLLSPDSHAGAMMAAIAVIKAP